jgi:tRNA-dihydrouridine synthase B
MNEAFPVLKIGGLAVEFPVFLAPMAGYSDAAFRSLCMEQGCGGVVSEMTNAYGLMIGHVRTSRFLETWAGDEHPAGAQIYGSDPGVMAEAAAQVAELGRFDFLDINAGCPMPKIRNRGDGSGLIRRPELLGEIVRQCKAALAGRMPLTVKTRVGYAAGETNIGEVGAAIEENGADAIFLHGRVALAQHSGPSDWEAIAEAKRERKIPVIGNGGIGRPADVFRMREQTGVDGVMVGRATLGNPWFFRQVREMAAGRPPGGFPSAKALEAMMREHLAREVELFRRRSPKELKLGAETTACLAFRAHLVRYLHGFRGFRTMARGLEERVPPEVLLARAAEVVATGRKCDPPPGGGDGTGGAVAG